VKVAAGDDYWQPGEIAHFEYHLTHPGRSDYRLWSRTQQPVTVLGPGSHPDNDRSFRIRFRDGHEGIAAADELVDHPGYFRPEFAYHPQALHQHVNLHQAAAECNPASYPYGIMPQHCLSPAMPPEQGVMPPPEPMKGSGGGGGGGKGPSGPAKPGAPASGASGGSDPQIKQKIQDVMGPQFQQYKITDPTVQQRMMDQVYQQGLTESGWRDVGQGMCDANGCPGDPGVARGPLQYVPSTLNRAMDLAGTPGGTGDVFADHIRGVLPLQMSEGKVDPSSGFTDESGSGVGFQHGWA
jgi:hypothetical protein